MSKVLNLTLSCVDTKILNPTLNTVKNSGGLVYFATSSSGGRRPPEDYIAKYTSAPRVFDTTEGEIKNFCVDTTEGEIKNF